MTAQNDPELSGQALADAVAERCPAGLNEYAWRCASKLLVTCRRYTASEAALRVKRAIDKDGLYAGRYKGALSNLKFIHKHMPMGLKLCDWQYIEDALTYMELPDAPPKARHIATWVRNLANAGLIKQRADSRGTE